MRIKWKSPEIEAKLTKAVREATSMADVCRVFHYRADGGQYTTLSKQVIRLGLDTSHFKGRGWNAGNYQTVTPADVVSKNRLRNHLLRTYGNVCSDPECQRTEWMGQPIALELDHIDGNKHNNTLSNVRMLCCNCHALTPTWRRSKERRVLTSTPKQMVHPPLSTTEGLEEKTRTVVRYVTYALPPDPVAVFVPCTHCGSVFMRLDTQTGRFCSVTCMNRSSAQRFPRKSRIEWPADDVLHEMLIKEPATDVARRLGVTSTAVKKHCKKRGLPTLPRGYWMKERSKKRGAREGT